MKKNVIVCMFDSLQFNYLGCYGNEWIKTPNFDRFAREGVLFENAYAEGMPTVPTRRVLQTGCVTLTHAGWSPLKSSDTTIADMCWGQGIDTALVFDCPMYRLPKYGYTRGYDQVFFTHGHEGDHAYYHKNPLIHLDAKNYLSKLQLEEGDKILDGDVVGPLLGEMEDFLRNRQYWHTEADQNCPRVMKDAVKYLAERVDRNQQFFLWVDSFDPHEPWDPPSVYDPDMKCPYDPDYDGPDMFLPISGTVKDLYTEAELNHVRMLYAEKVTMVDNAFGYFMDKVRELGYEENTLFIVISDHGEPMGNGEHGHGIMRKARPWPYEELVHIPLMIKGPGIPAGQRITSMVQNYDITATITNWLGIHGAEAMDSKDLMPLMTGQVEKIRDFCITGWYQSAWSIVTPKWSYIHWLVEQVLIQSMAGTNLVMHDGNATGIAADDIAHFTADKEGLEALERYKKGLTLDGADQWTCTPGSLREVPSEDQLFDRETDPFQLNNIIHEHPEVARKLLNTLLTTMEDYKR